MPTYPLRIQPLKKGSKRITSPSKTRLRSEMSSNQVELSSPSILEDAIILTSSDKEDKEGTEKAEVQQKSPIEKESMTGSKKDEDVKKDARTESSKGDEDVKKDARTESSKGDEDVKKDASTESLKGDEDVKNDARTESSKGDEDVKKDARTKRPEGGEDVKKDARTKRSEGVEDVKKVTRTERSKGDEDVKKDARTKRPEGDEDVKKDARTESSKGDEDVKKDARTESSKGDEDVKKGVTAESSEGDEDQDKNRALLVDRKCAICQEIIINACRVSCGHIFCRFCVDEKMTGSDAGSQRCTICDGKIDEIQNCPEIDKDINRLISILSIKERLNRAGIKAERQRQQENKASNPGLVSNSNHNSVFENNYETPHSSNSAERHNLNFQEPYQYYDYEGNVMGASSSDSDSSICNFGPYAAAGGTQSHQIPNHSPCSEVSNSRPTAAPTQPMMLHETVTFHRVCMVQPDGTTENGQSYHQSQTSGSLPTWNPNSNNANTPQSHDYCHHQHCRPRTTPPPSQTTPTQTYYAPTPLPCNFYYQPQPYYAYQTVPHCSYPLPNYNNYGSQTSFSGPTPHQGPYDYYSAPVYSQSSNTCTQPPPTQPVQINSHNNCNFYESCYDRTVTVPVQLPGSTSGTAIPVQLPIDLLRDEPNTSEESDDGDDYLYRAGGHYGVPQYDYSYDYQEDRSIQGQNFSQNFHRHQPNPNERDPPVGGGDDFFHLQYNEDGYNPLVDANAAAAYLDNLPDVSSNYSHPSMIPTTGLDLGESSAASDDYDEDGNAVYDGQNLLDVDGFSDNSSSSEVNIHPNILQYSGDLQGAHGCSTPTSTLAHEDDTGRDSDSSDSAPNINDDVPIQGARYYMSELQPSLEDLGLAAWENHISNLEYYTHAASAIPTYFNPNYSESGDVDVLN